MSRNRTAYFIIGMAIVAANYALPGKIMLTLLICVAILPLFTFFPWFFAYKSVKIVSSAAERNIYKGDTVKTSLMAVCNNPFSLAYFEIALGCRSHGKTETDGTTSTLLIYGKIKLEISHKITCNMRGSNQIGVVEAYIYDVLGLFKFKMVFTPEEKVFAYLKLQDANSTDVKAGIIGDGELSQYSIQRDKNVISHIRKYEFGDNMKHIHWKLSAKSLTLMQKEFEPVRDRGLVVFADFMPKISIEQEKEDGDEDFTDIVSLTNQEKEEREKEKILSHTITTVYNAVEQDIFTKIIYYSDGFSKLDVRGEEDFFGVYRLLSDIRFGDGKAVEELISFYVSKNNYDCNFLVITEESTPALELLMAEINNKGGSITALYTGGSN